MNENQLKITPNFIIEMIFRRRWLILLPLCVALTIGIYMSITLPRVYEAHTLILIEPQRVPQNYVQSIVSAEAGDRISTLSQQIMSRTNLEKIINDFDLFSGPKEATMYDEDKIKSLVKRISIKVTRDRGGADAFSIAFRGQDPQKVMGVTNGLANSFIDENLKVRESQAIGTSDFLDSELENGRKRLEVVEEKIKEYRKTFMGELPEQLDTNLRILDRLQENLNDHQQNIRAAKVRLADLNAQAVSRTQQVLVIGGAEQQPNDGRASLEELRAQLDSHNVRYTQKHPDILRLKKLIAELEAKQDALPIQEGNVTKPDSAVVRMSPQLRLMISEIQREIRSAETEIVELNEQVKFYQRRVENTPKREQELLSLRRDYQNIQASYDSLLTRKLEADIAVNMERKQKGEQFRIVDSAKLPQKPILPNMKKIFLFTLAGGLGIGGIIAFLVEFLNTTYRKPEDIESAYDIPVLVTVPRVYTPWQQWCKRVNFAGSVFAALFALGLLGILAIITVKGVEPVFKVIKIIA